MKIKVLSRGSNSVRECSGDLHYVQKNLDPKFHPLQQPREYMRALVSAKMDRMFARPFIGALSGHKDGVYVLERWDGKPNQVLSGSGDGEIKVWSLATGRSLFSRQGHSSFVRGLAPVPMTISDSKFISVGEDKLIKYWDLNSEAPELVVAHNAAFTSLSHHYSKPIFVTTGEKLNVWDHKRSSPLQTYSWGTDTIVSCDFNKVERNIFISSGVDRALVIYDLRMNSPVAKSIMVARPNDMEWNPMEAFNFTVANDDSKCYTFDMRNLSIARHVHRGHTSAVMSVSYSPTGEYFTTGSYDKSIRIFKTDSASSLDIYHTKRMQRVFSISYTSDGRFIVSGSDEGNIRIWKHSASEKLGILTSREVSASDYSKSLINKYQHMDEIRKVVKSRQIPVAIRNARNQENIILQSKKRKLQNIKKHSKPGTNPFVPERTQGILEVEE